MVRNARPVLIAALGMLTLASCSADYSDPSDAGTTADVSASESVTADVTASESVTTDPAASEQTISGPSITPTPDAVASSVFKFSGVAPVTDEDGYTFDIAYDYQALEVYSDPADEMPGSTSARIRGNIDIQVTNTTPGRNLSFPLAGGISYPTSASAINLVAAWSASNPLCQAMNVREDADACTATVGYGRLPEEFAPGETVALEAYTGRKGPSGWTAGIKGIPEEQFDELVEYIENPDEMRLYIAVLDSNRFGVEMLDQCSLGVPVHPDTLAGCNHSAFQQPQAVD